VVIRCFCWSSEQLHSAISTLAITVPDRLYLLCCPDWEDQLKRCRFMRKQRRGPVRFDERDLWERLAHVLLVTPSLSFSLSLLLSVATNPPPPRLNLSPAPSFLFYNGLTLICMQMCPSSIPLIVWLPAVRERERVCVCVCVCVCLCFTVPQLSSLASAGRISKPAPELKKQ